MGNDQLAASIYAHDLTDAERGRVDGHHAQVSSAKTKEYIFAAATGGAKFVRNASVGIVVGTVVVATAPAWVTTGLVVGGTAVGGYVAGQSIYEVSTGNEVDFAGNATGKSLTIAQRIESGVETAGNIASFGLGLKYPWLFGGQQKTTPGGKGTTSAPAPGKPAPETELPCPVTLTIERSPYISSKMLANKSRVEIRQLAKDLELKSNGKLDSTGHPRKWMDPVTGKERLRLDDGHVNKDGTPYADPKAANPHVHGYDRTGKILHEGNPHIPTTGEP